MGKNRKTVPVAQLSAAVAEVLSQYSDAVADGMDDAVEMVSKQAVKDIKAASPVSANGKHKGEYKKGWIRTRTSSIRGKLGYTIHNKYPGLPHLLEHGHALVNGGRAKAIPHIAPAEEKAVEELQRVAKELIQDAGK